MRRYTDEERLDKMVAEGKAACYDCGLDYGCEAWADLILPDSIWQQINPTHHRTAGLLCCNCIIRRLRTLGLENVPFQFTSGPFAFAVRRLPLFMLEGKDWE